jgi:hypothetical protein
MNFDVSIINTLTAEQSARALATFESAALSIASITSSDSDDNDGDNESSSPLDDIEDVSDDDETVDVQVPIGIQLTVVVVLG